jgi:DNA-binding transcriptional regulator GbsR (MarR family)
MPRRGKRLSAGEALVVETVGRLAEAWGLKRTVGQCWAVLFMRGRPTTAAEVQHVLGASTGAVSMTLKELGRWGVIRRVHRADERRKLYVAEVDVWRVVARVLRARELAVLDSAVDNLEHAVTLLRAQAAESPEGARLGARAQLDRVEGLLDLVRIVASMIRVLVTTARLDATMLATFRLSGDDGDAAATDEELSR